MTLSMSYPYRKITKTRKIYKASLVVCVYLNSTCCLRDFPEPPGLSSASSSSGETFTLDSPKARDIIFSQVEAEKRALLMHPRLSSDVRALSSKIITCIIAS